MTSDPPPRGSRRADDPVHEAFDAVRANSEGKSRDEVEDLLRAELRARGIEMPESLISSAADVLAHPHGLLGRVRALRFGVTLLTELGAQARAISDIFEGAAPGVGAIRDPVESSSAWVEVKLDDYGRAALRSRRERLGLSTGVRDQVAVRLKSNESAVDAYVDSDRVGTLARRDGMRYLPAISAAREHDGRGLLTLGIATADHRAQLRLLIASAETNTPRS